MYALKGSYYSNTALSIPFDKSYSCPYSPVIELLERPQAFNSADIPLEESDSPASVQPSKLQ
jgi:hypothetical protein